MAISDKNAFKNLDAPTHLKYLRIITQSNSCLPNLYIALTQIVVNKIDLEEWFFKYLYIGYNQNLMSQKLNILKKLLKRHAEFSYYIVNTDTRTRFKLTSHQNMTNEPSDINS